MHSIIECLDNFKKPNMGVFEAPEQSWMIFEEKRKYSNFNKNYKATDPRRQVQLPIPCEYQALSHDLFQGFFFRLGHFSTNMLISELHWLPERNPFQTSGFSVFISLITKAQGIWNNHT